MVKNCSSPKGVSHPKRPTLVHRASHSPLGKFALKGQGAFPKEKMNIFFTSGLGRRISAALTLDTRAFETHRKSVRFSDQPSPRRLAVTGRISFASRLAVVEAFAAANAWLTMIRCLTQAPLHLLAVRSLCQAPTQITLFTFPPGPQRADRAVGQALGGDALLQTPLVLNPPTW